MIVFVFGIIINQRPRQLWCLSPWKKKSKTSFSSENDEESENNIFFFYICLNHVAYPRGHKKCVI